jgi:hypothetical protein
MTRTSERRDDFIENSTGFEPVADNVYDFHPSKETIEPKRSRNSLGIRRNFPRVKLGQRLPAL